MRFDPCLLAAALLLTAPLAGAAGGDARSEERWQIAGEGVLLDRSTHLLWTRSDSARDVSWEGAKAYCSSIALGSGGWRLPSVDELARVYLPDADTVECGSFLDKTFPCKVSPLFRLSGPWFWSATPSPPAQADGAARAWDINLINGMRHPFQTGNAEYGRALCVREA